MTSRRWIMVVVLLLAIACSPSAFAAEPRSAAEVEEIERIIHEYLMRNPQVIIDALQAFERRREAEKAARAKQALADRRTELLADPTSPVGGNESGDVTIVEFFDYRCPHCRSGARALAELLAQDRGVRVVYKEFPILGPESVAAARAALAARQQGGYEALHRALMTAPGSLTRARIMELATSVGLDAARLERDMQSPEVGDILRRTHALAEALAINATPAFVIGDELRLGALDAEALRALVAQAREAASRRTR
jgi:protein-disulfide isomerase